MKQLLILMMAFGLTVNLEAQNLDKMNERQRKEMLLKIGKATVMEFGPDFYREYGEPVIFHGLVGKEYAGRIFRVEDMAKNSNRSFYRVTYLYDKTQEDFYQDFAAEVHIWGDTGEAFRLQFGLNDLFWDPVSMRKINKTKITWTKRPPGHFDPPKPKRVDVEYVPKKK